jgi:toxin ParE1/3/4
VTYQLELSPQAEADIDDILEWSVTHFGTTVRDGYEELINAAIDHVAKSPYHLGSHVLADSGSQVRVSHLRLSRTSVPPGARRIATPRHFIVYRVFGQRVQIVRVLHAALDIAAHID